MPRSGIGVDGGWLVIAPPGNPIIRLDARLLDRIALIGRSPTGPLIASGVAGAGVAAAALSLVPGGLREAAVALGAPKYHMILRVAYRAAQSGIITGVLVFVPYLGVKMLRQVPASEKHSHGAIYDTPPYRRLRALVAWCVRQRKMVVFGTVALLVLAGVGMATVVQKQFFPSSDRPEVLVGVYLPQGTAVAVTDATVRRLEAIMAPMPEVKTLSAYVGAGAPRFFISANPEPPNPAFGKLIAVAQDEAAREKIIAVLEQRIRDGEFGEARVRVQRLLYGPPVIWPVQFRVFGPDPQGVRDLAYRVREVMAANPHVVDAHLEWDERVPVLHLRTDADRLRLMGFTPQDVAQQLQLQLDGAPVTQLRRDTRSVDLVARGGFLGRRPDPQALAGLELLSREGRKVPAAQLGTLEVRYEEPVIKRYNREPFVAVQGEIRGAQPNDVTAAVWQALDELADAELVVVRVAPPAASRGFSRREVLSLAAAGAHPQRPLWASTGVKNPDYSDTLYVTELVAPNTVNTMPEKTIDAVADHGVIKGDTITGTAGEAQQVFDRLEAVGIDLRDVFLVLEDEGVGKFEKSWQELLDATQGQLDDKSK